MPATNAPLTTGARHAAATGALVTRADATSR